jgi:hypothetical protein
MQIKDSPDPVTQSTSWIVILSGKYELPSLTIILIWKD